jgi:hypothetical protein
VSETPTPSGGWIRDGHAMRVVIDGDTVLLEPACPAVEPYVGFPCRQPYDASGEATDGPPEEMCGPITWWSEGPDEFAYSDIRWEITGSPFLIAYRWDDIAQHPVWAPLAWVDGGVPTDG